MADSEWKISGTYFETCNCEAACPCVFLSPPTEDDCTVLIAWHIDNGQFESVKLDGMSAAFALHSPGHMAQVKWEVAVYLDSSADASQKEALIRIFSGQAGGHPSVLAAHVGNILGITDAAIDYKASGRHRSITIGDIAAAEIQAIDGQGGAEITVTNHPLCIAPGNPAVAARSTHFTLKDQGFDWELSGKNGFYSPFTYASA